MIKIGIPRALLYYQYYPMWQTFFGQLGAELVVSPPTTQVMLSAGSSRVVSETCLPVKVFMGHVLHLVGKCDYVFIPAIRSVKRKVYNCSKFLGLPDMTKAVIPESSPILDVDIDINKGKRNLYQAIYRLGQHFTLDPFRIRRASLAAWQTYLDYQRLAYRDKLTSPRAIDRLSGTSEAAPETFASEPLRGTVALVGHPYLLYDEHVSHRLVRWLEKAHYRVLTPEMVAKDELEAAVARLTSREHWTYEEEVVGAGEYYLGSGVDGVIGIMAFGCGPDSLMMEMVRRQAVRLRTAPFMSLTLEEHTAETGVVTRLEAFLDMVSVRKRKQVEVCL